MRNQRQGNFKRCESEPAGAKVRPKVALIAPDMPEYCVEFAELAARSCDVTLFLPDKYFHGYLCRAKSGLEVIQLPWPRQRHFIRNLKLILQLALQIRRRAPDIVHILMSGNVWISLLRLCVGQRPVLTQVHDVHVHPGDESSRRVPACAHSALVRGSDAIITHGEILRSSAIRRWRLAPERSFSFPHPPLNYYLTLASRNGFLRPEDGTIRVLFFGRIYEYKGLRYLVDAAPIVHRASTRCQIYCGRRRNRF